MEIRSTKKDYKKFLKFKREDIEITLDDTLAVSIIMIQTKEGELVEWIRGRENIFSFLKYGYMRVIKNCPYRIGKCIGEKCSLFFIDNNVGDCSHIWGVVRFKPN